MKISDLTGDKSIGSSFQPIECVNRGSKFSETIAIMLETVFQESRDRRNQLLWSRSKGTDHDHG